MPFFVCSQGDLVQDTEKHTKCTLHENCTLYPMAWPIDNIESEWRLLHQEDAEKKNILTEATTCSNCHRQATFLCIFGGHMLCASCNQGASANCHLCYLANATMNDRLKVHTYPLTLNPFAYMYTEGAVLNANSQKDEFAYLDGQIIGPINKVLLIRCWQYEKDRYPSIFTSALKKTAHPAWRVDIVIESDSTQLTLMRCRCMWTISMPSLCVKKAQAAFRALQAEAPQIWQLISHPFQLFMFAYHPLEGILCLSCRKKFSTLQAFTLSPCSLFSFDEIAPLNIV